MPISCRGDDEANLPRIHRCRTWCCALCIAALALLAAVGCSDRGPPRTAIEGDVSCDGQPMAEGTIMFIPVGGTAGPKTGAMIDAGHYSLPADQGPLVGTLRVEIWSEGSRPPNVHQPRDKAGSAKGYARAKDRPRIPERYNRASTLEVQTHAEGINRFDFELTAKP